MPKPLPTKRTRILLLVSLAGITAASVGLALADAARRPARRAAAVPAGTVDCQALNARLRTCAAHIAAIVDPEVPDRLGRMAPPLKSAITSVMADELQARVGSACRVSRGRMSEGPGTHEHVSPPRADDTTGAQARARCDIVHPA